MAIDWASIQAEYLAGIVPVYKIAQKYGLADNTISRHAKKKGWIRNPAAAKARKVAEELATGDPSTRAGAIIDEAVAQDVKDMRTGLEIAREILEQVRNQVAANPDVRDLKCLSETLKINIELIRCINGLDDKELKDNFTGWTAAQLEKELERLQS